MGSSSKSNNQLLGTISKRDAERLLLDWVHLPDDFGRAPIPGPIERMLSRFPSVFADYQDCGAAPRKEEDTYSKRSGRRFRRGMLVTLLSHVRHRLRRVWDAPDSRHRELPPARRRRGGVGADSHPAPAYLPAVPAPRDRPVRE